MGGEVVGRKGDERNGVGRCLVEGDEQEKFEEREGRLWGAHRGKLREWCLCIGTRNSRTLRIFFSDFLETVDISLPYKAVSGEVGIKAQIVLLCFSCNRAVLPSV